MKGSGTAVGILPASRSHWLPVVSAGVSCPRGPPRPCALCRRTHLLSVFSAPPGFAPRGAPAWTRGRSHERVGKLPHPLRAPLLSPRSSPEKQQMMDRWISTHARFLCCSGDADKLQVLTGPALGGLETRRLEMLASSRSSILAPRLHFSEEAETREAPSARGGAASRRAPYITPSWC